MRKRVLTKQLAVVLSEELYKQVIEATDKQEISISQFIRESVEDKIDQIKGEETNE